jgi:hypothetical protein
MCVVELLFSNWKNTLEAAISMVSKPGDIAPTAVIDPLLASNGEDDQMKLEKKDVKTPFEMWQQPTPLTAEKMSYNIFPSLGSLAANLSPSRRSKSADSRRPLHQSLFLLQSQSDMVIGNNRSPAVPSRKRHAA